MALRYLAGRIGVPALRRASGSRLAQPAPAPAGAPRRFSSSSHQGGYDNGAKSAADVELDRLHAELAAECEAAKERIKEDAKNRQFLIGACLTGVGMALFTMWHSAYKEVERARYLRARANAFK